MDESQTSFSAVLGVVLTNQRKLHGLEQGQMAEMMGLSQASYSRLEAGKSGFSVDQMYQAATALSMNGRDLIALIDNTVDNLRANGVHVAPQVRGNSSKGKKEDAGVALIAGAALGALLIGILSKK